MHFLRDGERTEVRPVLTTPGRFPIQLHLRAQPERDRRVRPRLHPVTLRSRRRIQHDVSGSHPGWNGVTARVTHTDRGDEEELIRCQYLVAADGINSRVRRGLGMSVKGKDYSGSFFQNLDIHLNGFTDWTDHFHYCVGTDHFLMVAPLPGGHFRLLLSDRGEAADPTLTPQQAFMRVLERHFDGITMGDVVWHSKLGDVGSSRRHLSPGQCVSGGRFRARPFDDGRAGDELLHAGRLQSGMEARARAERLCEAGTAGHLRGRTSAGRRTGHLGGVVAARHLHDARQGHRAAETDDVRAGIHGEGRELLLGRGLHLPGRRAEPRRVERL